jgi:hypothetical protein
LTGYVVLAGDVGNLLNVTGGVNFTTGWYEIISVNTGSNTWTLDRNVTSGAGSAMTGNMGGCLLTPGFAASLMVAGNTMHVKAGTYSITSASTNVIGGCVSLPASGAANTTRMIGYNASHRDYGTRPLLQAGTISTFTVIGQAGATVAVENIIVDGASKVSSKAFSAVQCYLCKALNCTNGAFATCSCVLCEATGCASTAVFAAGTAFLCAAYGNSFLAFSNVPANFCVACNNTGASTDGFGANGTTIVANCVAYNNGRDGFRLTAAGSTITSFVNCIGYSNVGNNFNGSAVNTTNVRLFNCAAGNPQTGANFNNLQANSQFGNITLTKNPFANPSSAIASLNDVWKAFTPNTVIGGGSLIRNTGLPLVA